MLELIVDFLIELIPDAVEELFSSLIDKHIRHRGVRNMLKAVLFVVTSLMTVLITLIFGWLLLSLLGNLLSGL